MIRVQGGTDVSTGLPQMHSFSIPVGGKGNATAFTALQEALVQLPIDTSRIDLNEDGFVNLADQELYLELAQIDPNNLVLDFNGDGFVNGAQGGDADEFNRLLTIALNGNTMTVEQSQTLIRDAFEIDPSVDLSTFLHFDEALAGNPLAGTVLLGENKVNTVVAEIQAVLAGNARVARGDHRFSGLFSEAIFTAIARQLQRGDLDLSDPSQIRSIILETADLAQQWMGARGLNAELDVDQLLEPVDDISQIVAAQVRNEAALLAETEDPEELALLITKAKVLANGKIADDLYAVASGTLSAESILADDTHTGAQAMADIHAVLLPPRMSHVEDVFLFENATVSDIPLIVTRQARDGIVSVEITTDTPDLLSSEDITLTEGSVPGKYFLTVRPVTNQHGVAHVTLLARDSAGSSVQQDFTVTVAAVNRGPLHPWQNSPNNRNVNADGAVSPVDVLIIFNYLEANGSGPLPIPRPSTGATDHVDTNGDDQASPLDALLVINSLDLTAPNAEGAAQIGVAEAEAVFKPPTELATIALIPNFTPPESNVTPSPTKVVERRAAPQL
ncbi:MAG: dockerin type I domain-containing protein, partial [Planctomycetota bacterium]